MPALTVSAKTVGVRAMAARRRLTDGVLDMVSHITVRDAATLRRDYPGLRDDEIADELVASAIKATAAVGAAAGSMTALQFASRPFLLAAPVQIAAETLAVVTIEVRLVAELHELTGLAVAGGMRVAGPAYLMAWVDRRAVQPGESAKMVHVIGAAARQELQRRVSRRIARSTTSLLPFMAGAVAGAEVNRRSTRDLSRRVRADLRRLEHRRADVIL